MFQEEILKRASKDVIHFAARPMAKRKNLRIRKEANTTLCNVHDVIEKEQYNERWHKRSAMNWIKIVFSFSRELGACNRTTPTNFHSFTFG